MSEQLYQVRVENLLRAEQYDLIMIAPLSIISQAFRLASVGELRVKAETKDGGICKIHFNGMLTPVRVAAKAVFIAEFDNNLVPA